MGKEKLIQALNSIEIPKIPDDTQFWLIRTQGGVFYNEYIANGFVALGWNLIDRASKIDDSEKLKELRATIVELYNEKRPGSAINKCERFIKEVQEGDIVMIPNSGSTEFSICRVGEYYEVPDYSPEFEIAEIKKVDNGKNSVKCPYKKRRKISLLLKISAKRLGLKLTNAASNYHGISCFNTYAEDILNCVYNCYEYKGDINYTINIAKQCDISARDFSTLLDCISGLFCEIVTDEQSVSISVNLNSPGRLRVKLKSACRFLKKRVAPFLLAYIIIFGGSGFGFEFDGIVNDVIDAIKKGKTISTDIQLAEAQLQGMQIDNYQKYIDLIKACNDADIDLDVVIKQMENANELWSLLQLENNLVFAVDNTKNSKEIVQEESVPIPEVPVEPDSSIDTGEAGK